MTERHEISTTSIELHFTCHDESRNDEAFLQVTNVQMSNLYHATEYEVKYEDIDLTHRNAARIGAESFHNRDVDDLRNLYIIGVQFDM